jgi:prepilin-type N-terminal cleavage/methylation domain-containing protein
MRQAGRREDIGGGFTLVEVMIVVVIVAILALVAVPIYKSHLNSSRMSEGVTGVGVIRTALRTYAAGHRGLYPTLADAAGDELSIIGVAPRDLEGRYFSVQNYLVNSNPAGYTVRATLGSDADCWYQINTAGNEIKRGF